MNRTATLCATLVLVASVAPGGALAPESAGMQQQPPFVSGGVGVSAQEELKARAREFNLKLVFTLVEGNYVAGVRVVIRDASASNPLTGFPLKSDRG